jgi:predicted amidophosphoribosyltransferase
MIGRDCREEFRPLAERFRGRRWRLRLIGGSAVILCGIRVVVGDNRSDFAFYAALGAFFASIIAVAVLWMAWLPRLACPSCSKDLDSEPENFCPECGQPSLKRGWLAPRCFGCGRSLGRGRGGRSYRVRYCPRCDARLDDRGV